MNDWYEKELAAQRERLREQAIERENEARIVAQRATAEEATRRQREMWREEAERQRKETARLAAIHQAREQQEAEARKIAEQSRTAFFDAMWGPADVMWGPRSGGHVSSALGSSTPVHTPAPAHTPANYERSSSGGSSFGQLLLVIAAVIAVIAIADRSKQHDAPGRTVPAIPPAASSTVIESAPDEPAPGAPGALTLVPNDEDSDAQAAEAFAPAGANERVTADEAADDDAAENDDDANDLAPDAVEALPRAPVAEALHIDVAAQYDDEADDAKPAAREPTPHGPTPIDPYASPTNDRR